MTVAKSVLWAIVALAVGLWGIVAPAQALTPAPFTQDQVNAGNETFMTSCASCHGMDLAGATAPALTGNTFSASWSKHTTADLYTFIKSTMPYCQGGTLADDAYTDIVAFILSKNGAKAGSDTFTATTSVRIGDIVPPTK